MSSADFLPNVLSVKKYIMKNVVGLYFSQIESVIYSRLPWEPVI